MGRQQTSCADQVSRFAVMVKIADRLDLLTELQGKVVSLLILVATLQICFELVMRYFFNAPTMWGLEVTVYLCGITYIMSGAYAERYGAHIRVDVFYSKWRPRTRAWFDLLVADMFLFFFSGMLFWHGTIWFWEAVSQDLTSGTIWDPIIWPMRLMIVLGALMLFVSGIPKFLRDLSYAVWNVKI
jgi:TRAP-type mannitol/chloroaromatic compound transport system permease small subunit